MSRDYYYPKGHPLWWWTLGLVACYTLAGFFLLPRVVKTQLEKQLSAGLGRSVTIAKVTTNPYALSLMIEGLDVRDAAGRDSFVAWQRLYVNFEALASLGGDWVLRTVELEGFDAKVAVEAQGSLSFADIIESLEKSRKAAAPAADAAAPEEPGRPVRVDHLQVTGARVEFADLSLAKPFHTVVGPLTFTVRKFRTAHGHSDAPYHFEAVTEADERLVWTGTLGAIPFQSTGELRLERIQLAKYSPYYASRSLAQITDGLLTVGGRYELNFDKNRRAMKLTDGLVQLRNLRVLERPDGPVALELPQLDVAGIQADHLTGKTNISSLRLTGGHLHARRAPDGVVNLLALVPPASAPTTSAPAPTKPATTTPPVNAADAASLAAGAGAPAPKLDVRVGEITLQDFRVDFADEATARLAKLALTSLQFSLKDFTLAEGATMPLSASFAMNPESSVNASGALTLAPKLGVELKLDVAGVALAPLSPYLETAMNAQLARGRVHATLAVRAELPAGAVPSVQLSGDAKVQQLAVVDAQLHEELAGFEALALQGVTVATVPTLTVSIGEVSLDAPYARAIVDAEKKLNFAALAKSSPPAAPAAASDHVALAPAPVSARSAAKIDVAKITITGGDFSVVDQSITPQVQVSLSEFGGTVTGLSSANPGRGAVDLRGVVDHSGPVAITGKLDPFGEQRAIDLTVDFKNVDLVPLSPYVGKYAGYELARGKLVLDVKFALDGKKIDAANVVTLNQFTFGAPVASPEATKLPVRLGVALLKDMNGRIVIDVPVQGNLDDPNFRIGRVVLRVVVNLLTKAAVSPFSLVGSMFGGGGEELAFQQFSPGAVHVEDGERKKLETLVKALQNRPGLSLAFEGSYETATDSAALKRARLDALVRRSIWEMRREAQPDLPPPGQLLITPGEHAAMVGLLFAKKFPDGVAAVTTTPAAMEPAAATVVSESPAVVPSPEKPVGFFRRLAHFVTFKDAREARAVERANRENAERAKQALVAAKEPATAASSSTGDTPAPVISLEEMERRLMGTLVVSDGDLRALAQAREHAVRDYFVTVGQIAPERLFLTKEKSGESATLVKTGAERPAATGKGARVFLSLQ